MSFIRIIGIVVEIRWVYAIGIAGMNVFDWHRVSIAISLANHLFAMLIEQVGSTADGVAVGNRGEVGLSERR